MKSMSLAFVFGLMSQILSAQSLEETLGNLDRELVVERIRKAYVPVSIKLDGEWLVTTTAGTETWKFANQKWTCPGSQIKCEDWIPLSFKWFGGGRGWLAQGGPVKKISYDFKGSKQTTAPGRSTTEEAPTEDHTPEVVLQFEGKRSALEVWEWNSPLSSSMTVSLSLRDFLIERISTGDGSESIEWAPNPTGKGLGLQKIFIDRGSDRALIARK